MIPTFSSSHCLPEDLAIKRLGDYLQLDKHQSDLIAQKAADWIGKIRVQKGKLGEVEQFLAHYKLSSPQGLALMTMAESLLRIPDSDTQDELIAEKMSDLSWDDMSSALPSMKVASFGLNLAQKTLGSFLGGVSKPVIRKAMIEAVKHIGGQFVMGETIDQAIKMGRSTIENGYRLSFDMLGEGARCAEDAQRYFENYKHAAQKIGAMEQNNTYTDLAKRSGLSVKLSALHPRYHYTHAQECVDDIYLKLKEICNICQDKNISLTLDAEEADRLDLSFYIIEKIIADPDFKNWTGLGFAIQAYDKRCFYLIDDLYHLCDIHNRSVQIRLVKGAYWDTEIKRSQSGGHENYPVFTRKENTDLSYLACAKKLLSYRTRFYPMFATHNAHTAQAIFHLAGNDISGFEFQRLYGMGEALGDLLKAKQTTTIYAPVGPFEDLLPYLVRRMLENGANTSFVNKIRDLSVPENELAADPVQKSLQETQAHHPLIPLPQDLFGAQRRNSQGLDLSCRLKRQEFLAELEKNRFDTSRAVTSIIDGQWPLKYNQAALSHFSPNDRSNKMAESWDFDVKEIEYLYKVAEQGFKVWKKTPHKDRRAILEKCATALEERRIYFASLLIHEAGKTIPDTLAEIREAVDFIRYYASEADGLFSQSGKILQGYTGEENRLYLEPRGIFVCISPWNFPLAIFVGQMMAALATGNAVIVKPAEQTPIVAFEFVRLMMEMGLPKNVCSLVLGDGKIGQTLIEHKKCAGVVFTGSTETAKRIQNCLAQRPDGPIIPFIAETGGQNAMIVDSSALPEHVVDDVMISAFGSAGQRCSALRVLFLQQEIADKVLSLLSKSLQCWHVGTSASLSTDIGPVIDDTARNHLQSHIDYCLKHAKLIAKQDIPKDITGSFIAPHIFEIPSLDFLTTEHFGPILHVVRYAKQDLNKILADIQSTGYGLTFGLHTRLQSKMDDLSQNLNVGNIYINRSMIGAVVGVQPFGGFGLSGTGPKAGGPYYLHRFVVEKTISNNTMAIGGNISLLSHMN
jgi:RHH-type transcriptional regulator, proline utilization regulon repressor / proline dehydrogenase / delta 1-pyrroline-5-carboxylate dehydrogenase